QHADRGERAAHEQDREREPAEKRDSSRSHGSFVRPKPGESTFSRAVNQIKGGKNGIVEQQQGQSAEQMLEADRHSMLAHQCDGEVESKKRAPASERQKSVTDSRIAP